MRFLRNPHRDARLLQIQTGVSLATTGRALSTNPNVRAYADTPATNYATMHGNGTGFSFAGNNQYGAGVFIRGPGNDGDLWKYYRVIMTHQPKHLSLIHISEPTRPY